jgi:hypothetical protein
MISSLELALTNEQISALDGHIEKFRAASYEARENIVQDMLHSFKRTWPQGIKNFSKDEADIKTVRVSFATLGCSHIFLAYSPAPLWKIKTGDEEFRPQSPKSDGRRKVRIPFAL